MSSDAVTGHKLQGVTKDNVIVVSWQKKINWMWVVFSRVRTHLRLRMKDTAVPESFNREFQAFMERTRRIEARAKANIQGLHRVRIFSLEQLELA